MPKGQVSESFFFLQFTCVHSMALERGKCLIPSSGKPQGHFISFSAKMKEANYVCRLFIAWQAGLANSLLPHALICRTKTVVWTVLGLAECSGLTPLEDTQVDDLCRCVLPVAFQGRLCCCCCEPVLALVFSLHRQTGFVLYFCTVLPSPPPSP